MPGLLLLAGLGLTGVASLAGACGDRREGSGAAVTGAAPGGAGSGAAHAAGPGAAHVGGQGVAADPTATAAPPAGDTLVLAPTPPRPGASSIITYEAQLDLDLNFGGLQTITSTKQAKKKQVQFVSADPDGTTHKRITYLQRDTHMVIDGEPRKDITPIRGKTYDVAWRDAVVTVRRADGSLASPEEDAAVRSEEVQLQVPELIGRALAGVRLVEGAPFEVPLAAIEKLYTGEYRPRRVVLTYRGRTAVGARIDAEAALASQGEGTKFFLDLEASLVLDATGWCREAKVTARIRAEYQGTVVGSGAGKGTVTATPPS